MKKFSSYSFGEARTGIGQLIKFSAPNKGKAFRIIKAVIRRYIRTIDVYETKKVKNLTHGSYGRYTRYDITQHQYAGSRGGYIEILEIQDAPDNRWPLVMYEHRPEGATHFSEWENLELAKKAWDTYIRNPRDTKLEEMTGFKRLIKCEALTPWFYAVGDQALVGDYAFPDGLQDDPIFTVGKYFVVTNHEGHVSIKKCLGCRFLHYKEQGGSWDRYQHKQVVKRIVYWDDGTTWADNPGTQSAAYKPRPLRNDELWITEAWEQFGAMFSGEITDFSIPFIGGRKFIGKVVSDKTVAHQVEGEYLATVTVRGREPMTGRFSFSPTPDIPDAVSCIYKKLKLGPGEEIERVEIKDYQPPDQMKSQKKRRWSGVFFRESRD